jgi:hypothetical protein
LRVATERVRLTEGVLSSNRIANSEAYLAQLQVRISGVGDEEVFELLTGSAGFSLRVSPRTANAHHLRAPDAADTGEAMYRLALAPARGSLCPFAGTSNVT